MQYIHPKFYDVPIITNIHPVLGMEYAIFDTFQEAYKFAEKKAKSYGVSGFNINYREWHPSIWERSWITDHRKK